MDAVILFKRYLYHYSYNCTRRGIQYKGMSILNLSQPTLDRLRATAVITVVVHVHTALLLVVHILTRGLALI